MASSCDMCAHYVYDDEDDFYECLVNMDEDDFARFVARGYDNCPYFQLDDEYGRCAAARLPFFWQMINVISSFQMTPPAP